MSFERRFAPLKHTHVDQLALPDLTDVAAAVASPSDGDILVFRTSSGEFVLEAKPVASGAPAWGDITGTLSNQTDLQAALDAKPDLADNETVTGTWTFGTARFDNLHGDSDTTFLTLWGGLGTGANIELYAGSHATEASNAFVDASTTTFRTVGGGSGTAVSILGDLTATTYGGIAEANLLDKSAVETVTGEWDFTAAGGVDVTNLRTSTLVDTATNHGREADLPLVTFTAGTDWNMRLGQREFLNLSSTGAPNTNRFFIDVVGRRDTLGGRAFMAYGQTDQNELFYGYAATGGSPSWVRVLTPGIAASITGAWNFEQNVTGLTRWKFHNTATSGSRQSDLHVRAQTGEDLYIGVNYTGIAGAFIDNRTTGSLTFRDAGTEVASLGSTGTLSLAGNIQNLDSVSNLTLFGGAGNGANIELYGGSHASFPDRAYYDASLHTFRTQNGGTTGVTISPGSYAQFSDSIRIGASTRLLTTPTFRGTVNAGGTSDSSGVGSYNGFSINNDLIFMHNGSVGGIYDEINDQWRLRFDTNRDPQGTGVTSSAQVGDHGGTLRDVGYNLRPRYQTNASFTWSADQCGGYAYYNSTTSYTITIDASSSDLPVGAELEVTVAGTGSNTGTVTLSRVTGTSFLRLDGTGPGTIITSNIVLNGGSSVVLRKYSSSEVIVLGAIL